MPGVPRANWREQYLLSVLFDVKRIVISEIQNLFGWPEISDTRCPVIPVQSAGIAAHPDTSPPLLGHQVQKVTFRKCLQAHCQNQVNARAGLLGK